MIQSSLNARESGLYDSNSCNMQFIAFPKLFLFSHEYFKIAATIKYIFKLDVRIIWNYIFHEIEL